MFSAFFWCIFGVMLIVVANTWVARIPFARLAAGIALYMQLGGVFSIIAGVVFFFHSGPVTTPTLSYADEKALWAVAVVPAIIVVMAIAITLSMRADRVRRSLRPEFETANVTLVIHSDGMLHISEPNDLVSKTIPLGRVGFETQYFEADANISAFTLTTILEWPEPIDGLLNPETARVRAKSLAVVQASPDTAKALNAWVRKHPVLGPDWGRIGEAWKTACNDLLRYCREQRNAKGAPVIEAIRFEDGPSIDYVAIEKDGSALAGTGTHPHLMPPVALHAVKRKLVVAIDGRFPTFELNDDQVRTLQKMHARGEVRLQQRA
ncbi:hypothetical protein KR767_18715 [Luteibacter anthropi]|uniref:hypothetical protein n=1 Tax=Luteibacter anthropi TaxID=564369 RepID=UPI0020321923|nr:hypothetical protein [Luteibacter anthropi]URX62054.1 hypothetical protein KR767_18715 [Luteibacter anthropi]